MFYFVWAAILILIWLYPTWLRFGGSGSLVESKWCPYVMVEADSRIKLLPTSILDTYKVFEHIDMLSMGIQYQLTQLYPPYLAQILGLLVTCVVKMMSLCRGWSWQPNQTASHIHIRHLKNVWACWYAAHGHTVSALHSYTHPLWLRFWVWGSGSLVESKWCHYVMVEADSHTSNCFPHPY